MAVATMLMSVPTYLCLAISLAVRVNLHIPPCGCSDGTEGLTPVLW